MTSPDELHTKSTGARLIPLWTGAALVVASLAFVAAVRLTGTAPATSSMAASLNEHTLPPRDTRDLRFADRDDRGVEVIDATTNVTVAVVPPGTNGFLRATLRGLAHQRLREGGSADQPFRLSVWDDGRVRLEDLVTHRIVALEAFGLTNRDAFASLVATNRRTP